MTKGYHFTIDRDETEQNELVICIDLSMQMAHACLFENLAVLDGFAFQRFLAAPVVLDQLLVLFVRRVELGPVVPIGVIIRCK